ncbi:hypothetical protein NIES4075_23410 [Tolypothrix sp. NIES-4075]|nr:hypothetical protein NIES4075_23410 [Tolypothrix sp. NIES-4075]
MLGCEIVEQELYVSVRRIRERDDSPSQLDFLQKCVVGYGKDRLVQEIY